MVAEMWNLPAPPGFRGLDPLQPVTAYYRHLPHWRQDGASYFVTFRLADSLPQEKLRELALYKEEWEKAHRPPRLDAHWEQFAWRTLELAEAWLDQGMGNCWLREPWAGEIADKALHYFDGSRYELGCFVIMPNHVHAIIRPLLHATFPLERILQSRKRAMAIEINKALKKKGKVWQEESFDRIVRDEEHLYRCLQYIGKNPAKGKLPRNLWRRWIRPQWVELGWRFEDKM